MSKQRTNVRHITNPDGSEEVDSSQAIEIRFEYDGADNLLKTIYGDGSFTRREYDAQNRVVAEIDALGNRIEMEYDEQSRLAAVSLPAVPHPTLRDASDNPLMVGPRWQYQYDGQGNLTQIRDNFAQVSPSDIRTDHNGAAGDDTRITTFQFNSSGQQTGRTLPSGNTEEIRYDVRGRPTVHVSFEGVVEQRVYDDTSVGGGRLAERRFFDSLTAFNDGTGTPIEFISYRYDALGREISAAHHRADGVVDTYSRTYSDEGRVIEESSPRGIVHYEFDALGRQRRVWTAQPANPTAPVSDVHYSYNALGRLSQVDTVTRDGLLVDSKPTVEGNQPEVAKYFYDLLGRLDRAELPGLVEAYTFDPQGQVQTIRQFVPDADNSVLTDNAPVAEYGYTYRADGKRTGMIEKVWFDDDSNPATPAVEVSTTYAWTYDNAGRLTSEAIDHFDAAVRPTWA